MDVRHALSDAWMARGACRAIDVVGGDVPAFVCDGCVVRIACLEFALLNGSAVGRWGGHTPAERIRLLADHDGDVDEALIASFRLRAVTDAAARRAAMARHPSTGGPVQLQLGLDTPTGQLSFDIAVTNPKEEGSE